MGKKKITVNNNIKEAAYAAVAGRLSNPLFPPITDDHAAHIESLVLRGHSRLAADHLLFPDINGCLAETVAGSIRRLNLAFIKSKCGARLDNESLIGNAAVRRWCYEYLIELSLNFTGLESRWLEIDEKDLAYGFVLETLLSWEKLELSEYGEPAVSSVAVECILKGMELVQGGASMVAKSAGRIRRAMKENPYPVSISFLGAAHDEIISNIYHDLAASGKCKFGNDYALGLRWLRHLGFEQVSTNPVLAAKAYEDDPMLSKIFACSATGDESYETWKSDAAGNADDITLFATLLALWDNLHVFRPVFYNLEDTTGGGVVSFQLNPNLAHRAAESIDDALKALELAQRNLAVYDSYLLAGYDICSDRARPNMVIKVAASDPAALKIASSINAVGLGSNITVVYTVSQEVEMILAELEGMAEAVRKGIVPTQMYMTNMGGRFESHLREEALLSLFGKLRKKLGEEKALKKAGDLARKNGNYDKMKSATGYDNKVFEAICFRNGVKEIDANIARALSDVAEKKELELLESDIQKSGTLVVRRVWEIFFSDKNREKWVRWLCETHSLTCAQAELLMSRINCLPASKRKPLDTLWTLSSQNMVHTEFGNHQENVLQSSLADGFDVLDFSESIRDSFEPGVVDRLNKIPDFVKGYELTKKLNTILADAGIVGDYGTRGITPAEWSSFGAVQKTITEFKGAYDKFKNYILGIFPV